MKTRVLQSSLSGGRIGKSEGVDLRDATLRMGRSVRGVPAVVANIWYGFTRSEPRNKRGHLLGAWPDVARAFARMGAPLVDVMAPAYEVERELRHEVYRNSRLPSLDAVEQAQADAECLVQRAEIAGDVLALREAERSVIAEAALVLDVLETDAQSAWKTGGPHALESEGRNRASDSPQYRRAPEKAV